MEKSYSPPNIEKKWYSEWESRGYFQPRGQDPSFCIMLPPPNVTGQLHMGHAFQDTLMDALIRYHRMQGHNTLWQMGTDHAGIATQMVVERQLAAQNISRHDLGREAFLEKVWEWKNTSGNHITGQMRRLGASGDWASERFTLDEGLSKAVQTVFIELYKEGLIYRGERLVNWDPILQTALSDLEVLTEEEAGSLWHIRYPIIDSEESFVVATTRPETLFGDEAVAVHPDDTRYQHLIGKEVALPLTNRRIPIIADTFVDMAFGTGCVKITPAHDFNDYQVGQRHQLPLASILSPDMKLNHRVPPAYQGMDRFEARKKALVDLENRGLLVKTEPHTLKIPRGDRTQAIIEPLLTMQWYVKVEPLAKPAIDAVKDGHIKFVPQNWENTYFSWMENIQDWCISRQLWWGHRIPAWYDESGNAYVGESESAVRAGHHLGPQIVLKQDNDVLDTWFSSALWPFSTLGWPTDTERLKTFYPTQVLVTGFDIIFFWVARMIMMGLKFTGQIPFKTVYVHGLIQDAEGQKMSKSKGNTLDPLDLIDGITLETLLQKRTQGLMQPHLKEKIIKATQKQFPNGIDAYGTDALRFTFCALASTGRHIRFDLQRVEGYRHFCNKIWNATRYVLMQTENHSIVKPQTISHPINQWILNKLDHTTKAVHSHFEQYRFDWLAQELYDFTWNVYCDWYLELSKPLLSDPSIPEAVKEETRYTLLSVLETLLRLLHPIIPFITEEIWQRLKPLLQLTEPSIMLSAYPADQNTLPVPQIDWLQQVITTIRNIRGENQIPPNKAVSLYARTPETLHRDWLDKHAMIVKSLCKSDTLQWLKPNETPPLSATGLVASDNAPLEIFIPLKEFMNKEAELARLQKEMEKCQADITRAETKLNNPALVAKAPPEVIEKERLKLSQALASIEKIKLQIEQIKSL